LGQCRFAKLLLASELKYLSKMKEFWNERYGRAPYAYGETPNVFFAAQIGQLSAGKLLLPAEGEGRNAVYAAQLGWAVSAFDLSEEGRNKALALAKSHGVEIGYQVGEFTEVECPDNSFDAMALIYAHFPASVKSRYHRALAKKLKSGGVLIFEAFSKAHLELSTQNPSVGGPRELDMLFSLDEIAGDFQDFAIAILREETVHLAEGIYHNGLGAVVRLVGIKK
jgi:hypothetical protein